MTFRRSMIVSGLAALAFGQLSTQAIASTNLVTNGSFETNGGVGQLQKTNNYAGTTLSGWTVGPSTTTSTTYAYDFVLNSAVGAGNAGFSNVGTTKYYLYTGSAASSTNTVPASTDGGYFFGSDAGYGTAAISQTISGLTKGAQYTLSFLWAGSEETTSTTTTATNQGWTVGLGTGVVGTTSFSGATLKTNTVSVGQSFSGWQTYTTTFAATGTSEVLSFLADVTPTAAPAVTLLDGVSVTANTPAVPEPASLTLLAAGLVGLAGLARRRQASRG